MKTLEDDSAGEEKEVLVWIGREAYENCCRINCCGGHIMEALTKRKWQRQ